MEDVKSALVKSGKELKRNFATPATITSLPKKFLILVCDLIGVDGPPNVLRPPALCIISDWSTFAE